MYIKDEYSNVIILQKKKGKNEMKDKLKMIYRIIHDKQVIVITKSCGRMYCDWIARSLEDVCQICHKVYDIAYTAWLNNK